MITQLQAEYLSRLDGRYLKRQFKALKMRTSRLAKARVRKARSVSLAWYRRQYFLATANSDMRVSIRRNEDICIAITVIAAVLGYAYAVLATEVAYTVFLTAYTISEASGANMLIVSTIAAVTLAVTLAWVAAFLHNSMSIALMQGANRNKIRSVRSTLRQGLAGVGRTASSWLLLLATISLPIAVAGLFSLAYFKLYVQTPAEALEVVPYGIIAAAAGVTSILLRYSLVPAIALFEPTLSYKEVFARSKSLVTHKGMLFIAAAYGVLAAAIAASYGLSLFLQNILGVPKDLVFSLMALAAVVYFNGIMIMFYRKRRMARSR